MHKGWNCKGRRLAFTTGNPRFHLKMFWSFFLILKHIKNIFLSFGNAFLVMNLILAAPSDKYQGLGDNVSSSWTMLQLSIHWLSHVVFGNFYMFYMILWFLLCKSLSGIMNANVYIALWISLSLPSNFVL